MSMADVDVVTAGGMAAVFMGVVLLPLNLLSVFLARHSYPEIHQSALKHH